MVASLSFSERRAVHGHELAHVLLDAREPRTFEDLMAAAGGAEPRDVAAWLGHAVAEGLVAEDAEGFLLRSRGRRVLGARRRAQDPGARPVGA